MGTAAPLQFRVNRHRVWRAVVLLLAGITAASMLVWWRAQPSQAPLAVSVAVAAGVLAWIACVAGLWQMLPTTLRWDGQRWQVARGRSAECSVELAVAIDLGGWLLLRFVPEGAPAGQAGRRRPTCIALQRLGFEARWHAIRCALYRARPVARSGDGGKTGA